jgi:endoglucanase
MRMKRAACCALFIILLASECIAFAQAPPKQQLNAWWQAQAPGALPFRLNAKKLPLISVKGNKFVDPAGNVILFRGLSISDPDKLASQGHWSKEHFIKVQETGAKVVRIPVHPAPSGQFRK